MTTAKQEAYANAKQRAASERAGQKAGGVTDELKDQMQQHSRMIQKKSTYLPMWQEIADRCDPDSSNIMREYMPGGKRTQWMFDSTAPLALKRYQDAVESATCPETSRWMGFEDVNSDLNEIPEVQKYYKALEDVVFKVRYAQGANFTQQMNECFGMHGLYGNCSAYVDDYLGRGIRYRSMHIKEQYFAENFAGNVDWFNRQFKYSSRQAVEAFQGNVPTAVRAAYDRGDYLTELTYVHSVKPNKEYTRGASGQNGLKFLSHYFCWDQPWMCRSGWGYKAFPYPVGRFRTVPGDIYARGPASLALPDIKQVNEMEKVTLRQAQMAGDPIVLLPLDGNLSGFNMQPGALVWGGMSSDGKRLAEPFNTAANFQVQKDVQEGKRKLINDSFYVTLFQALMQTVNPQMTATEALLRAQEAAQLLMPSLGRLQSEFMSGIAYREIEIIEAAGIGPPKPRIILDHSHGLKPRYTSPLNQAQQAQEGVGIMNTLKSTAELKELDPSMPNIINSEKVGRRLAKINGMSTDLLYTDDELQAQKQANAQQQNLTNLVQAAPQMGAAAKDFATAQSMAGQGGGAAPQTAPVVMPGQAA